MQDKYIFITFPRMGTKHVQDKLVRASGVTDCIAGNEFFRYKDRDFKFSLGEFFRNFGFVKNIRSFVYFRDGQPYEDWKMVYRAGLPDDCYAYQIDYDEGWTFSKQNYVNYSPIVDADFEQKWELLRRFGKSYVVKVLFDQHSIPQLRKILQLTKNVVGYLKADLVNWLCSYHLVRLYQHTDPRHIARTEVDAFMARVRLNRVCAMIDFCRTEGIPIVINSGDGATIFDVDVGHQTTFEYSRFGYSDVVTNYDHVRSLVRSVDPLSRSDVRPDSPPVSAFVHLQ